MRILFCGSNAEAQAIAACFREAYILSPEIGMMDTWIKAANEGKIDYLIATPSMATGWHAPAGTLIFFTPSFPNDPVMRAQAEARVRKYK